MPVESVTTPKRIPLVYQNLAKNAKEKIEQGSLLKKDPCPISYHY